MEIITSRKNPVVSHFRKLAADRDYRRESGLFLGQGRKLLEEALASGTELDTVLYSGEAPALPRHVRCLKTTEDVIAGISPMKSAPDFLFSCALPAPAPLAQGRLLLAEDLQDPGNVGTMARTAAAFGFDGFVLAGACADPWGPKAVRASMGAVFRLKIWELPTPEAVRALEERGLPLYAAALQEPAVEAGKFSFPEAFALAIGNEGHGLSETLLGAAAASVRIPMMPGAESLNAAAAAAVLMWESYRGRRVHV